MTGGILGRVSGTGITVHVCDDTFIAASPRAVADAVADPGRWRRWWPDLTATTTRDRGVKGHQWLISGALHGTAEVWLEPWRDGTVVHLFLRLDFAAEQSAEQSGDRRTSRRSERERTRRVLAWKRDVNLLKDELERGRAPGDPAAGAPAGGIDLRSD